MYRVLYQVLSTHETNRKLVLNEKGRKKIVESGPLISTSLVATSKGQGGKQN